MGLTRFQDEVLTGLMLGDGNLSIGRKAVNPRLRINRSARDWRYAQWIDTVFSSYCTDNSLKRKDVLDKRNGKFYPKSFFSTRRHPDFMDAYRIWYGGGEKTLPNDLVLTPIVVSIWFADDGSLWQKYGKRVTAGVGLSFSTSSFGKAGSETLRGLLNERYEGGFSVYGGYKGKNHFQIVASSRTARRMARDIDFVFPPLSRKSKFWRGGPIDLSQAPPFCPRCRKDAVYKNGFYTGRGTVRLAQRFKCRSCSHGWKEGVRH